MNNQNIKVNELNVQLNLVNNKLHFIGNAIGKEQVSIDYIPPHGDNLGHTSLELFLLSLSSCLGSSVLLLLRKMNRNIEVFTINAKGVRKNQHPTCFEYINLEIQITSKDVIANEVEKAIELSEDSICPVWAMIKGNVEVTVSYKIQ
jgi:putative redox protein